MLNTIWKITTVKEKIITFFIMLLFLFVVGLAINYQYREIQKLNKQIVLLEVNKQYDRLLYDMERSNLTSTIERQNKIIEDLRIDEDDYKQSIHEQEIKLLADKLGKQSKILKELEKDSSLENQFKLISNILLEFSIAK